MVSPYFSVVIPCYNEEDAILPTIQSIRGILKGRNYELIVVNDGSTDRTSAVLADIQKQDPHVHVLHHSRNMGYGAALKTGVRRAASDWIVLTDADGTYPNERLPELIDKALAQNADMVVGARVGDGVVYSKIRAIPKMIIRRYACWLAAQDIPDVNSGMRVMRKSVVIKFLKVLPDTFSFTTTITLSMLTNHYDVEYVPISYKPRIGKSKIKPIRDTLRFFQLLVRTGMYFAPLRVLCPLILLLSMGFIASLCVDVFYYENLTDKTILLLLFAMNSGIFALLADMIDKRSPE